MTDGGEPAALLARAGFRTPEVSLRELPEGWRHDERWRGLLDALGATADPDAGLRRLRALDADVVDTALADPVAATPLLAALGYSEYLSGLIARTEGLGVELCGGPSRPPPDDVRELRDMGFVRIAAADLAAPVTEDSFDRAAGALTTLADSCLERVLAGLADQSPFAVMAMGKYGAQELNYASDIDVLFVAPDGADTEGAARAARRLIDEMNGPPTLFRVDADLRPEGRDGPLVRTLGAFRSYYERWAQVWEFQSLIKCRFAAGDEALGGAFMELIENHVWPERMEPEAIEQVRALKARAEREATRRGRSSREVKLGPGGIRDVEFAVQLLQLVHGRHHPNLRVRGTLEVLEVLGAEGFVAPDDADELAAAYVFLRHTEHRLQLERGRQTHTLPRAPDAREHLARGLGFRDTPSSSALEAFERRWSETTTVVRTIHERLFYRPLMETFAAAPAARPALSDEEADERLAVLGFDRPPRVREAMTALAAGSSRRAKVMRAILPGLLAWLAETPEPDQGMMRLVDVARRLDALPHLLAILRDEPPVAEILCAALGTGPVLAGLLERDPSLVAVLGEGATGQDAATPALAVVRRATGTEEALAALRRFKDGELLRIATEDLASGDDPEAFERGASRLSGVADACLEAALEMARRQEAERTGGEPPGTFAVVGMGRLGGREMSYPSDLDVMFVYERDDECPDGTDSRLFWSAVAERLMQLLGSVPPIFKVDAELRPEGRSGPIVRSLESFLLYYQRWAQLWEFQALTRARHVAGSRELTSRLLDAVAPKVWRPLLSQAEVTEIRQMKVRIERERVDARTDRRFHVKLGTGGLNDVEFTVQLLQMRHAHRVVKARTGNTLAALEALREGEVVRREDAQWLRDAYLLLNRVRNHLFLLRGLATDALPTKDDELERLARSLGYGRLSRSRFLERYRRVTRRARRVTDRLFFGEGSVEPS